MSDANSLCRMTSAAGPSPTGAATTTTYAYDGLGDRLSVSDAATTLTTTTDDQSWPTTADSTGGAPDVVYSWNADGSLAGIDDQVAAANDRTFGYDAWGGTSSATAGTTTLTYGLDAFERTVTRTQGGAATTLTYQGASETLVKSTPSTGAVTTFSSTPGGPLSAKTGTATAVESLRDLHGDTVGTFTAAAGTTQMSDETWYSPFGEPTALAGGLPLLGYQGDLTDGSTGEVDMLTRQYVPSLGRFSTRDVLGGDPASPPSLNQWVYVGGNPVSLSDSTGLSCDPGPDACSTPDGDGDPVPGTYSTHSRGTPGCPTGQDCSDPPPTTVGDSAQGGQACPPDQQFTCGRTDIGPLGNNCIFVGRGCVPASYFDDMYSCADAGMSCAIHEELNGVAFAGAIVTGGFVYEVLTPAAVSAGAGCVTYVPGCQRVADIANGTNVATGEGAPQNVDEQLAIEEAQGMPGHLIIKSSEIGNNTWEGWQKMQWVHEAQVGGNITVHWFQNVESGVNTAYKIVYSYRR